MIPAYLPQVASTPELRRSHHLTRERVTLFLDIAGFTGLSENLAHHGTAGTEQLGTIVRRVIGGSLDIVAAHGGDAIAFGGDAITVTFADLDDARRAAAEVVELVRDASGTPTLAGPVALDVRVGISGGSVTSFVCACATRHVVVHLGDGLDRAVAAADRAGRGEVVVDDAELGALELDVLEGLPDWAPRVLHPVTASRVAAGSQPPDEHRRITTAFLAVPPVAVAELRAFVVAAADAVAELDGDVLQCTGGDKGIVLIAAFGVPVAHPDDPSRAVHAVQRLRDRTGLPFAAGVSTGLAFTASFGGETRRFASVLGDTANLAARLMPTAEPGATLIDAATAAEAGARLGEPRLIAVKNRVEPVEAAVVLGLDAGGDFTVQGETPLVGRAAELAAAERVLDSGGALHLVGEAGSGKSRLAAEIVRRARVRGMAVRAGRFEPFGGGRPLGPFLGMVDVAAIERVRPGDGALAPLLDPTLPESSVTARLSAEEGADLTRRLVADLLAAEPAPVVVDDLHWADDASLQLLRELDLPLVTTGREPPGLPGETARLADLPADDLRTLARDTWARLGGVELPDQYLDTIVERSAGSPRFAQTVTELARRDHRPGVPLPEVPFPDRLLPLLTARLDALGDEAQATALRLAVLGRPVRPAGLGEVFGLDVETTGRDVRLLVDAGIAVDARGGYVELRQAAVGWALLDRASHADRAPLHELVCEYLLGIAASPRDVATHLEHCDIPRLVPAVYRDARDEAARLWLLAEAHRWAELAAAAGDERDAVALAQLDQQLGHADAAEERLRGLSGPDAERLLGRIAFETGRPAEAVEHLRAAERAGAEDVEWPLTMALCDLGRFAEARERAEAQLAVDDPWLRLDALANLGPVEAKDGRLNRAAEVLAEARELAEELGDTLRLAHVTGDLAGVAFMDGRVAESAELLAQATALAERLGARRLVAMVLGNLTKVRMAGGDLDGATRAAVASMDALLGIGDVGLALDVLQTPIDAAEIRGENELAARWWREHALLEERLGRPHDAAISWFRHAAVSGDPASLAAAEHAAEGLETDDLALHRQRAERAVAGDYTPPPEAGTTAVDLPSLDAHLPVVTSEIVDGLFARTAMQLDQRAPVHI